MANPYILRKGVSELADLKDGDTARDLALVSQYHFYVDSDTGSNGNEGTSMDKPFATIDYAVGRCPANKNAKIIALPGHAETINTAAAIDLDVEGIHLIGLGSGEDRPTITCGSDEVATTVEVGAANVTVQNMLFKVGVDSLTILLDVNKDDCTLIGCEFRSDEGSTKRQAITYVDVNGGGANAADRFRALGCRITSITAGADEAIEIGAVQDGIEIRGCVVDGDFENAGLHSASAFTNAVVADNYVSNRQTGDHAIAFTAACTGFLSDNRLYGDTLGTILDPGSLKCNGNLETDAVDQAGVETPRTSAGGFPADSITADSIATGAFTADAFAADAIVAATFNTGALTADAFAADALVAATFNTGALTADAFAADALVAATFATGALTADAFAANAIVAATLNADCITNAKIADDAIAAENLATGALTADAFAADAIIAATLATGALTADAFAADAIVAATLATGALTADAFAADAIVAATLATGVLTSDAFALSAGEYTTDGIVVTRAAAALPQTAAGALFTITGHVLLKRIVGVVTVELGAVGNIAHLQLNSTGAGATTDLCLAVAGLDVTGDVVDTTYEITGTVGDAMVATTNLPKNPSQLLDLLLVPGSLEIETAGSDGGDGRVRWSMTYVPMEAGAGVVAA